tara:strand:+ start:112 stop:525 length:414 start_codon:yes stop_codon:yes gene_type:complete
MKTWVHLSVSLILMIILYPIYNWEVLLILVGGVFIDFDHYLWYIYKYKRFNLLNSYRHYTIDAEKNNFKDVSGIPLIFHTIEFLLVIILLSFFNEFVLVFTIGLLSHYLLDLVWQYSIPKRLILNFSITSWIVKNRK